MSQTVDPFPVSHVPVETAAAGQWGGPTYGYRGAVIACLPGGHVCGLSLSGHPLDGMTFGVVGTIMPLIDLWLDKERLPDHMVRSLKV